MSTALIPTSEKTAETLTERLQSKLSNPETTSNFDLHAGVDEVLKEIGMTSADTGGELILARIPSSTFPCFGKRAMEGISSR